ncbi:beta strand repeat-containing protein [Lysobacter antibioticus]|uniref:beta strand repeat-containing protein n=1 Tax=Lysobacter antibioticus TaxID=84531 RepID=UPI0004D01614|nr:right-handed parallel beta-helix repeat-containing protein [Lysobacter antibioticus]
MNLRTWIAAARRRTEPMTVARSAGAERKRPRRFRIACLWLLVASSSLWAGSGLAATYTVTSLGDAAGTCAGTSPNFSCTTLRAAITAANLTATVNDSIVFSVGGTINVGSELPIVSDTLTLNGAGITLNGNNGAYQALRFAAGAGDSQLRNISIRNFAAVAVSAANVANMLMNGNTITMSAAFDAIRCSDSNGCTITNNTIGGIGSYAISVFNNAAIAGYQGRVAGNRLSGVSIGVALSGVTDVTVDSNVISGTSGAGIRLVGSNGDITSGNTLTNNTISGNTGAGIVLTGTTGGTGTNQTNDNRIEGNIITGNGGVGIALTGNANSNVNQNTITGNTITGNSGDGINVSGTTATNNAIYANTNISGNSGLGIDLGTDGVNANDAADADTGPNTLMNYPVVTSIVGTTVKFVFDTTANANGYRIDFYRNPGGLDATGFGEGQVWLSSCTVAAPSASVPSSCTVAGLDAASLSMTATRCQNSGCVTTATTSIGSTSEFSGPSSTDLRISKTDGQTQYGTGQTLTYTIVVSNAGTTTVSDAVFTDPAVSGLSVTGVACGSATLSSQCPVAASTTVALMQGAGIVIPRLTADGSVTFTVTAMATASGGSLTNTAAIAVPVGVSETAAADNSASDTDGMQPSFGTCDSRLWLEQSPGAPTPTTLYQIGTNANPLTFNAVGTATVVYNAVGYNPTDNYQYGLITPTSNTLVRIGSDGAVVSLGTVSGLPVGTYISGAFGTAGNILYVKSNLAAGTTMYAINVTTMTATAVSLSAAIDIADWAWVNGLLYGVTFTGQLVSVNPSTGSVANIGASNSLPDGFFGAMYGAPNGLYGSGNNPPSGFYKFDLATGTATLISGAPGSSSNDGSNCPTANITFGADLQITKTNTPGVNGNVDQTSDTYAPGPRSYTVTVTNAGPFGAANAVFTDPAIAGFTVSSVTCASPTGGAVCPTVANTTVALMQGSGIVIPSLPYSGGTSSSVTFTIAGTIATSATGTLANTATVAAGAGTGDTALTNNSATDSDTLAQAQLTLRKVSYGGVGTFDFTIDQGSASVVATRSLTTATEGTVVTDSVPVPMTPGQTYRIIETTVLSSGRAWTLTDFSCTNIAANKVFRNSGDTYTLLSVPAGADIVCTVTDRKSPTFQTQKIWARAAPGDRVVLAWSRTAGANSASGYSGNYAPVADATGNNTSTSPPTAVYIGDTLNLSAETWLTQTGTYTTSDYICTRSSDGTTFTVPASGGSYALTDADTGVNLLCSVTNTRRVADLSITKTNTPAAGANDQAGDTVTRGAASTYTIVASNAGPDAADGAVIRDTVGPGLTCATVSCSANGGAVCPGTVDVATLQGSGLVVATFPANSSVSLLLTCTVQ